MGGQTARRGTPGRGGNFRPLFPVGAAIGIRMTVTRVMADWLPETRMLHYAYAALSSDVEAAVGLAFVRRSLKTAPNSSRS